MYIAMGLRSSRPVCGCATRPKSRDKLKEISGTSPRSNWRVSFAVARIGDAQGVPIVVSRTGYTGELGYAIWCHRRDAEKVFNAVWKAGEPDGLKPMRMAALDTARIEGGLIFVGYEFFDQTDPFEAGIGFTVRLKTKTDDFIGREALIRRKDNPLRKLVGLDIDANVAVGHGDCVHVGRAQIGEVTSSMRSPVLNKNIALARLDVAHAAVGTEVEIGKLDGHQQRLPARVVPFARYVPKKFRDPNTGEGMVADHDDHPLLGMSCRSQRSGGAYISPPAFPSALMPRSIFSGTPSGVGAIERGEVMQASIDGVAELTVRVA